MLKLESKILTLLFFIGFSSRLLAQTIGITYTYSDPFSSGIGQKAAIDRLSQYNYAGKKSIEAIFTDSSSINLDNYDSPFRLHQVFISTRKKIKNSEAVLFIAGGFGYMQKRSSFRHYAVDQQRGYVPMDLNYNEKTPMLGISAGIEHPLLRITDRLAVLGTLETTLLFGIQSTVEVNGSWVEQNRNINQPEIIKGSAANAYATLFGFGLGLQYTHDNWGISLKPTLKQSKVTKVNAFRNEAINFDFGVSLIRSLR
ncbi:MAG TPA: hypothetical protein VFV37_01715 [Luteibaculaceae bacterium]|nr:hypothetical protein [Luteibaculaceae bacterium]